MWSFVQYTDISICLFKYRPIQCWYRYLHKSDIKAVRSDADDLLHVRVSNCYTHHLCNQQLINNQTCGNL